MCFANNLKIYIILYIDKVLKSKLKIIVLIGNENKIQSKGNLW